MLTQVDRLNNIRKLPPVPKGFHQQRNSKMAIHVTAMLSAMLVMNSVVLPSKLPGMFTKTEDFVKWVDILSAEGVQRLKEQSAEDGDDFFEGTACEQHAAIQKALKDKEVTTHKSAVNNVLYLGFSKDFIHNLVQLWHIGVGGTINGDKTQMFTTNDNQPGVIHRLNRSILPTPITVFPFINQIKRRLLNHKLVSTFNVDFEQKSMFINEFYVLWRFVMGNCSHKAVSSNDHHAEGWPWWSKLVNENESLTSDLNESELWSIPLSLTRIISHSKYELNGGNAIVGTFLSSKRNETGIGVTSHFWPE